MTHIEYFKLQAKNLFKDYKTKTPYIDDVHGYSYYNYTPKYFDIDGILLDYDYDETNFSLMKAQHIIALLAGFCKWTDLSKASEAELELSKQLFDNQDVIRIGDWEDYIIGVECDNYTTFNPEAKLEILKHVFLNEREAFENSSMDYRIASKHQGCYSETSLSVVKVFAILLTLF